MLRCSIVALSFLTLVSTPIFAQETEVRCLNASGYYGNIEFVTNDKRFLEINAEQGFAMQISEQLGDLGDLTATRYTIQLNPGQCTGDGLNVQCSGRAKVIPRIWSDAQRPYLADIGFQIAQRAGGHMVDLSIEIPLTGQVGTAYHQFIAPLGRCE